MKSFDQMSPIGISDLVSRVLIGKSVADIGCGSGLHSYYLMCTHNLESLIGVDFSSKAVSRLKKLRIYIYLIF